MLSNVMLDRECVTMTHKLVRVEHQKAKSRFISTLLIFSMGALAPAILIRSFSDILMDSIMGHVTTVALLILITLAYRTISRREVEIFFTTFDIVAFAVFYIMAVSMGAGLVTENEALPTLIVLTITFCLSFISFLALVVVPAWNYLISDIVKSRKLMNIGIEFCIRFSNLFIDTLVTAGVSLLTIMVTFYGSMLTGAYQILTWALILLLQILVVQIMTGKHLDADLMRCRWYFGNAYHYMVARAVQVAWVYRLFMMGDTELLSYVPKFLDAESMSSQAVVNSLVVPLVIWLVIWILVGDGYLKNKYSLKKKNLLEKILL